MSEATWGGEGGSPVAVLLGGILIIFLMMVLAVSVLVSDHAVKKHGDDALAIRSCLDTKGEYQIWKSKTDLNKFFRICELEPGMFGLQVVQCLLSGACEKTAFIKGDGSWGALMKYLGRIATKFNGGLP
ncbi:hypothetical protein LCGC14_2891940 [marine sediment metagenome]|uniref:Uncharacterized protein n=1 Tax=marine sediment metagenome TaxID=412755 RepID=A0A0F8XXA9_9ZZZZ